MPELTIPKLLSKRELYDIVIESIKEAGWNVTLLSRPDRFPLRMLLIKEGQGERVLIYIWNISHGGKTRSEGEYRIQMKGNGLIIGDYFKTLLLGWFDQEKVFVAFHAFKHRKFGKSPSVQVNIEALKKAVEHGIAFHTKKTKKGKDIVVTFQPSYIMEYIMDIYPQYHQNEKQDISEREMRVIENSMDIKIPDKELNKIPKERKVVVNTINKKIREAKFKKYVYALYKGKCAICGLQARLTEAAHIIPVKDRGTDEVRNGILLCRNHHKAYDSGLLAINKKYEIVLNNKYVKLLRTRKLDNKLADFLSNSHIGEKILLPEDKRFYPKKEYLEENCELKGI